MSNTPEKPQSKIYNLNGTLECDVEVRENSNKKPYALARVKPKDAEGKEKTTTVITYFEAGIAALQNKKAGASVRLYGTYEKGGKGQTFSAMGNFPEKTAEKSPDMPEPTQTPIKSPDTTPTPPTPIEFDAKPTLIEARDSVTDAMNKLAQGNPGAATALSQILQESQNQALNKNMPLEAGLSTFRTLLTLDRAKLHGDLLWMFYKDVCQEDPEKVCGLLEKVNSGEIKPKTLHDAARGNLKLITPETLLEECKKIPTEEKASPKGLKKFFSFLSELHFHNLPYIVGVWTSPITIAIAETYNKQAGGPWGSFEEFIAGGVASGLLGAATLIPWGKDKMSPAKAYKNLMKKAEEPDGINE